MRKKKPPKEKEKEKCYIKDGKVVCE